MRALVLFCIVALVGLRDGGRCFGYTIRGRVHMQNHIVTSNDVNERNREQLNIKGGGESMTLTEDEAKHKVDDFLDQIKRSGKSDKCGYEVCNVGKPGMLNVHLVPHTHDDVGWTSTIDAYFYGGHPGGVQYILDTVSQELLNNPQRRFIYVEMAFFSRWWNELHDTTRHLIKGLVSAGDAATLFTGTLNGQYGYPSGFCFECGDAPIRDDPRLEDYNVDERVNGFVNAVEDRAKSFATNHIMLTMGNDFHYTNARINFKNMDKLINYVNMRQVNGSKINAFYSTPSCYVYAMNQLNHTYTRKDDDFFPYANRPNRFWTGYFTSRPALKGYERTSNNFLQVCKQLEALSDLGPEHGSSLKVDILREALGVLQHHDGVSGTEKQHVANDYAMMVAKGVTACEEVVNASYGKILPLSLSAPQLSIQFCPLANVSNCAASESSKEFVVLIYNPIAREVDYFARIPVSGNGYTVEDAEQKPVDAQVLPLPASTYRLPDFKGSKATGELVFNAKLPALGLTSYFVKASPDVTDSLSLVGGVTGDDVIIKNEFLSLAFSGKNGLLKGLTNTEKSLSVELSNELLYYKSGGSGAYIFRPDGNDPQQIASSVATSVIKGSEVQEVRQVFSDWASQVVRLYKGQRYAEIEWTVGPIPTNDKVGKEVISRFTSNLDSDKTFYTDANGREMLKRVRDYRPTWDLQQTEPVSGNYYPVNSRIFIQDAAKNLQLTVLTDRSQGGSSIKDDEIELMLHRRILTDDNLGVSEPLNEQGLDGKGLIVRGKYYVILDTIDGSVRQHRDLAQRLYMAPSVSFVQTDLTPDVYSKNYKTTWSGLKNSLPENVHLLTLEQWHSGKFLLRLEHFYQKNEDKKLSEVAIVNLKDLFVPFTIASVEEQTLGANHALSKATRLQWNVKDYGRTTRDMSSFVKPVDPQELKVELKPMQIRTFHVTINE